MLPPATHSTLSWILSSFCGCGGRGGGRSVDAGGTEELVMPRGSWRTDNHSCVLTAGGQATCQSATYAYASGECKGEKFEVKRCAAAGESVENYLKVGGVGDCGRVSEPEAHLACKQNPPRFGLASFTSLTAMRKIMSITNRDAGGCCALAGTKSRRFDDKGQVQIPVAQRVLVLLRLPDETGHLGGKTNFLRQGHVRPVALLLKLRRGR